MKLRQQGFTLIELIMVIVILGILAATALPRFANLSTDARMAKMQGAVGSVRSASAITHASWLVSGGTTVTLEGTDIPMSFGYPTAAGIYVAAGISTASGSGFSVSTSGTTVTIQDSGTTNCSFTYTQPTTSGTPPAITTSSLVSGNCGG